MARNATSRVVWRGERLKGMVRTEAVRRLNKAAVVLHAQIVENISQPTRTLGPSAAGGYPHRDTSRLAQSITVEPATTTTMRARIGTNYKVAGYLELGTKRMAARPFLRPTLRQMRSTIQRVFRQG